MAKCFYFHGPRRFDTGRVWAWQGDGGQCQRHSQYFRRFQPIDPSTFDSWSLDCLVSTCKSGSLPWWGLWLWHSLNQTSFLSSFLNLCHHLASKLLTLACSNHLLNLDAAERDLFEKTFESLAPAKSFGLAVEWCASSLWETLARLRGWSSIDEKDAVGLNLLRSHERHAKVAAFCCAPLFVSAKGRLSKLPFCQILPLWLLALETLNDHIFPAQSSFQRV